MSYLALARKWRPRRFEDVRGQGHVVKALTHALDADRLHPAILLTGTRGVGKTTLARIIAKGLNCQTGVSATPCGVCSACKEVNDGRFVDLLEIDAASNTGVDNIREVIDNAQYAPARGRYKVYLIDEVHMLSKGAFNALLKTLEEPPPHVKFILATTDPQKLPITVLSRCLQFNLKRLTVAMIRDNLADILKDEGVSFEAGALAELARAADGSMRDGLSLLDQALVFAGGGLLTEAGVEEMLGTGGRRTLFDVLDALAARDGAALLDALRRLEASAPDFQALLGDLATALQRIAMLQLLPGSAEDDDDPRLAPLAQALAVEDVQLWYQTAVIGRRDIAWAPDPRLGFEMSVLRMHALRLDDEPGSVGGGNGATGGAAGGGSTPPSRGAGASMRGGGGAEGMSAAASVGAATAPAATAAVAAPAPVTSTSTSTSTAPATTLASATRPVVVPDAFAEPSPAASIRMPARSDATPAHAAETDAQTDTGADQAWAAQVEALGLDGMTRQLARHCVCLALEPAPSLLLDPRARHLQTPERLDAIASALTTVTGRSQPITLDVGERPGRRHPAALDEHRLLDRQRAAEQAIDRDPVVARLRSLFGATVRAGSVLPIDAADAAPGPVRSAGPGHGTGTRH